MKVKKDKTLEAMRAQGKKTEAALKAASARQEKTITRVVKASSKEQVKATNAMTKSMKGTMNAGFAGIASAINNQSQPLNGEEMARVMIAALAAHEQAKPKKSNVGLIIAAGVFVALLIAACWITAALVGSKVDGQVTEINQIKQELVALQTTAQTQVQTDQENLIKAVGEVVNTKLAAQSQTVPDAVKTLIVKQASELQNATDEQKNQIAALTKAVEGLVAIVSNSNKTIKSLEDNLENEKRGNEQAKQFYDERIAAVMGLVKAAKTETSKQSDVQVPVTVTVNAHTPVDEKASASASTTSSYSNDTEESVPVEVTKRWSGVAEVGYKSDGQERDGTIHSGSVIEANAKVFVTERLSVDASFAESSNALNKKIGLGVGYELFPWMSVGLHGEKRERDNRAILSVDFNKEVWAGKYGSLDILADAAVVKIFGAEQNVQREDRNMGYEAYVGAKYSLDYLSWSTFSLNAGLAYNSGFNEVSRVSLFFPDRHYYYAQDKGLAARLSLSNEFKIGKRWYITPEVTYTQALGERNFLGDVIKAGDLPKKNNLGFGVKGGLRW